MELNDLCNHTYILKWEDNSQHQSRDEHNNAEDDKDTLAGGHIKLER